MHNLIVPSDPKINGKQPIDSRLQNAMRLLSKIEHILPGSSHTDSVNEYINSSPNDPNECRETVQQNVQNATRIVFQINFCM